MEGEDIEDVIWPKVLESGEKGAVREGEDGEDSKEGTEVFLVLREEKV